LLTAPTILELTATNAEGMLPNIRKTHFEYFEIEKSEVVEIGKEMRDTLV